MVHSFHHHQEQYQLNFDLHVYSTLTYLLHLELDGGSDLINLSDHGFRVCQHGGEFTRLVQTGSEDTGDGLDDGVGSEEGIVFLSCKWKMNLIGESKWYG